MCTFFFSQKFCNSPFISPLLGHCASPRRKRTRVLGLLVLHPVLPPSTRLWPWGLGQGPVRSPESRPIAPGQGPLPPGAKCLPQRSRLWGRGCMLPSYWNQQHLALTRKRPIAPRRKVEEIGRERARMTLSRNIIDMDPWRKMLTWGWRRLRRLCLLPCQEVPLPWSNGRYNSVECTWPQG